MSTYLRFAPGTDVYFYPTSLPLQRSPHTSEEKPVIGIYVGLVYGDRHAVYVDQGHFRLVPGPSIFRIKNPRSRNGKTCLACRSYMSPGLSDAPLCFVCLVYATFTNSFRALILANTWDAHAEALNWYFNTQGDD